MLSTGIYQQIINQLFQRKLNDTDTEKFYVGTKQIGKKEAINVLTHYLCSILESSFASMPDDADPVVYMQFANNVITNLGRDFNIDNYEDNLIAASNSILTSVIDRSRCDCPDVTKYVEEITPRTSLNRSILFIGGNDNISLASELQKEIRSSDDICLVVSFIKQSGLNLLYKALEAYTNSGKRLRIITTTYTGATEYKAVLQLAKLNNTEVKISYDVKQDRLHAKAYIFLRKSGFNTAYIGSSNISTYTLREGKEWNLKATSVELPQILQSVQNSFESYWSDESFETFIPGRDDERLQRELKQLSENYLDYTKLDIKRAKDYQQRILEKLDFEREKLNHYRNLIVAATGTGKTVIAALDYKRFREKHPDHNNLLFLVHREEILKQAIKTFREILCDDNFGEIWSGQNPNVNSYSHIFASKDLINQRFEKLKLDAAYYDYIIVDEVHHVAADSYRKALDFFQPKILLGLTATPFRMDGQDVTKDFDGRISAEINLTDALNAGILAPFHYYGVSDSVDLDDVHWDKGHFLASELSGRYTGNDQRTATIIKALNQYINDPGKVKALAFCVDIKHAQYMHAKFTLLGLNAAVLTSDDTPQQRKKINADLRAGNINYLFVVDLFNEGVDIPEVDTILFLRPTESLTVFLQQFGRGLRLAPSKDYLTVLDFVGHTRAEFNYHDRFRAMIGRTSMSVQEEAERNFPHLPLDCHIQLEEKAREYILENINGYLRSMSKQRIINAIETFNNNYDVKLTLQSFLAKTKLDLARIYKCGGWSQLLYDAKMGAQPTDLQKRLVFATSKKWLSVDSLSYYQFLMYLVDQQFRVSYDGLSEKDKKRVQMFYYDLYDTPAVYSTAQNFLDTLSADSAFVAEMQDIIEIRMKQCEALELSDNSSIASVNPLMLHGIYTKAEIQVAIGTSTIERKSSAREGVERNKVSHVEAMFVDIIKDREEGSTTNYNDFAQSRVLFHWETQNRVSPESKEGKAYINGIQTMLLFVRPQNTAPEDKSRTMGYVYCGEVTLVEYSGSKPMQILWYLKTPMSEQTYDFAATHKAIG